MNFLSIALLYSTWSMQSSSVPLYMWNTIENISAHGPALVTTSRDSLKRDFSNRHRIVAFVEERLNAEDFTAESHPEMYKNNKGRTAYRPRAADPFDVLRQEEERKVLFVHLDGGKPNETRKGMLKRHDKEIAKFYKNHSDCLGVYTALGPYQKDLISLKRPRGRHRHSCLYSSDRVLMHLSGNAILKRHHKNHIAAISLDDFAATTSSHLDKDVLVFDLNDGKQNKISFKFKHKRTNRWTLVSVKYFEGQMGYLLRLPEGLTTVDVPRGHSYVCHECFLGDRKINLTLTGLQMQAFFHEVHNGRFGPACDCVGYTSIPILTGLMVAFLLLTFLLIGIVMTMNIKTNSRFDDVGSKPLFDKANGHQASQ